MTDQVIELAKLAGYKHPNAVGDSEDFAYFDLERFATLVRSQALGSAEKDAERYRWLRTQHDEAAGVTLWHVRGNYGEPILAHTLDSSIDHAMEASK